MSLITKMLNDLDRREAKSETEKPVVADLRYSPSTRKGAQWRQLGLLAALSAVLAGAVFWQANKKLAPPANELLLSASDAAASTQAKSAPAAESNLQGAVPEKGTAQDATAASAAPSPREAEKPASTATQVSPPPASTPPANTDVSRAQTEASTKTTVTTPVLNHGSAKSQALPASKTEPATAPQNMPETSTLSTIPAAQETKIAATTKPRAMKVISPHQQSENLYRQAIIELRQTENREAMESLRAALRSDPANHEARKLLADLLIERQRISEAEALLRNGTTLAPNNLELAMSLAHLLARTGKQQLALQVLQNHHTSTSEQPEYHAFIATLLQHDGNHEEAVRHYLAALSSDPLQARWLIGAGISLREIDKPADAAEAFKRALDTGDLSPQLSAFAEQQLQQLRKGN